MLEILTNNVVNFEKLGPDVFKLPYPHQDF